jgi:hypothetical protein
LGQRLAERVLLKNAGNLRHSIKGWPCCHLDIQEFCPRNTPVKWNGFHGASTEKYGKERPWLTGDQSAMAPDFFISLLFHSSMGGLLFVAWLELTFCHIEHIFVL